jgi:ATP-binding cassette subfamily B protein
MNDKKEHTAKFLRRYYWKVFLKNKKYSGGVLLNFPLDLIMINLTPLAIASLFDGLSNGSISSSSDLIPKIGYILSINLVYIGLMLARDMLRSRLMMKSAITIRQDFRNSVSKLDIKFFNNNFSGSIQEAESTITRTYGDFISLYSGIAQSVATISISSFILFSRSPLLVALILPAALIYSVTHLKFRKKRLAMGKETGELWSKASGALSDFLNNISTVKEFGAEKREVKQVGSLYKRWAKAEVLRRDYGNSTYKINRLIDLVTFMVIIFVSAKLYLEGRVGIGTIILVQTFVGAVLNNLRSIPDSLAEIDEIYSNTFKPVEFMMAEPEIKDPINPTKLKIEMGEITFQDASFKYTNSSEEVKEDEENPTKKSKNRKEEQHLFQNLNLTIKPGEKIGLVGPSGGGKSTLLKLILRFYDVDSGGVLIDGVNVKDVIQSKLRQQIAYVPQDPALFHRSIGENIGYSKPKATQKEVELAAKQAYADEFIETLPKGYETLVGERGVKLSGGQRQRVAIARAILKDAPILLLDEATSALDSESEKYIQKSLEKLMKGRTTVVVAHRLSTIQKMDRILVVENGKVIAEGPHAELLKTSKLYNKLWSHQSGGILQD